MSGVVLVSALAVGCAVSRKQAVPPAQIRPALEATKSQLIAAYNDQARAIHTVNAAVRLSPVAGSVYSGVIEEYRDVGGFILAAEPAMIRIIGQAPVLAKNIFDMISDGHTFRIYIPSKNKFLVGSTELERTAKSPIENLRPQHILDALFWPELPAQASVLFEQLDAPLARYYVLTLVRPSDSGLEIGRKVWFDRADLRISRIQIYGLAGRLDSDIVFGDWRAGGTATAGNSYEALPAGSAVPLFPYEMRVTRPQQNYQLAVTVTRVTLNAEVSADRFVLPQPPDTELVQVGEAEPEERP